MKRVSPQVLSAAVLAVAAGWAVYQHLVVPVLPYDDAFITYRYVDNLTRGLGLTYNPPDHVWGYTSPLYVLWLAFWKWCLPFVQVPTIAVRGNAAFIVAAGGIGYRLVHEYTRSLVAAVVTGCVLMTHSALLTISSGGMESILFLALVLGTLSEIAADRPLSAGFLWGLAELARPEAVGLLPVFVLAYGLRWRRTLRALGSAGVIVGAWLMFALGYYHSIVPMSIVAKSRPLYPLEPGHALKTIGGYTAPAVFGNAPLAHLTEGVWAAALVLVAAAILAAVHPSLRQRQAWAPGLTAACLVILVGVGNPVFFEWYWAILLGLFLVVLVIACAGLADTVRWIPRTSIAAAAVLYVPLAGVALAAASSYADDAANHVKSIRNVGRDATRLRIRAYQTIGEALNNWVQPGDRVVSSEIGALGCAFQGPILDACALVSPEALPFLPVPSNERVASDVGAISVELVQATKPAWVVTMPVFAERSLLRSAWFQQTYALVLTVPLPAPCFGSKDVLVYKRRSATGLAPQL
jgi:hypothetical protein